jgi:transposase
MYCVDGATLSRQYKEHISDFREWEQKHHSEEYVLYENNLSEYLSIDETSLSQGELCTFVTNKLSKGKKGTMVAMVNGTKSENVIFELNKMSEEQRNKVKEVTLDLSSSMKLIVKKVFPKATLVIDRFHVQKLVNEAVSDIRISYRWEAIEEENKEIALSKEVHMKYIPHTFENGDTRKQLLARSRHIVMKHHSKWTDSQKIRAEILFEQYPEIEEAYYVSMELTDIYNKKITSGVALTKLAHWYNKVEKLNLKYFKSVIETMQNNYQTIANYFINRSTNASAESFNAKIKLFRSQLRGIRDIPFFIYRLSKLFA